MKTKGPTQKVRDTIAEAPKGHIEDTDPTQKRNVPDDGPSGENTKNDGERGGGLWTSGGEVTSGTPYHYDEDEKK
ncbi:hypothetical protein GCM10028803_05750 [Larkinella knui]|uniref:Uncharacterized protein n=1 Tax=Larkinella knui TaxID=2025310 RepID=A0A3P1CKL9_9BACT|nr:hypothetical protein [Larkinella knui]RRB13750.1 hypothetical protein EHT87_15935 [Larkinella knui]